MKGAELGQPRVSCWEIDEVNNLSGNSLGQICQEPTLERSTLKPYPQTLG